MTRALPFLLAALLLPLTALVEWVNGRTLLCPCGRLKIFANEVLPGEDSQHLTDWYTLSHVIHGILFYLLLWLVLRRLSVSWRFALAVLLEVGWEVFENSRFLIERYRTTTMSADYWGDSIVNSMSDIFAMALGFWIAAKLPVWASIAVVVGIEAFTTWWIRDSLLLNIIMLVAPVQVILQWQSAPR